MYQIDNSMHCDGAIYVSHCNNTYSIVGVRKHCNHLQENKTQEKWRQHGNSFRSVDSKKRIVGLGEESTASLCSLIFTASQAILISSENIYEKGEARRKQNTQTPRHHTQPNNNAAQHNNKITYKKTLCVAVKTVQRLNKNAFFGFEYKDMHVIMYDRTTWFHGVTHYCWSCRLNTNEKVLNMK